MTGGSGGGWYGTKQGRPACFVIARSAATWQSTGLGVSGAPWIAALRLAMTGGVAEGGTVPNKAVQPASSLRGAQRRGNPRASESPARTGLPRFARNDGGEWRRVVRYQTRPSSLLRHCEERSDVAIHGPRSLRRALDCCASPGMAGGSGGGWYGTKQGRPACFVIARSAATWQSTGLGVSGAHWN